VYLFFSLYRAIRSFSSFPSFPCLANHRRFYNLFKMKKIQPESLRSLAAKLKSKKQKAGYEKQTLSVYAGDQELHGN